MKGISPRSDLRKRAEALLKDQKVKGIDQYSESDLVKMVHELEVHQIELEMLNDELMIANEQSIKQLHDRYAELYNLEPTGYFTLSQEGAILELNLSGARMLGKEQLHLIGSRFGFFISEQTKPVFNNFLDDVFTGTGTKECEVILTRSNDIPKYVQLTGIKSRRGSGQCLITMADITGQKEAQAKIQRSEIFLKTAQMIAGLGTFSLDLVKRTWESSEVLDLIFGIDPDFDKSFDGWISIVHPDWQKVMRDYFRQLAEEQETIFEIEYKIIRRSDQSERWIHVIGQIGFDTQKQPISLLGTIGDITSHKLIEVKLKESEKAYHGLISNLHIGVLVQGPLSEIVLSNNRALELLGLTEDQLLGKTSYDADWNVIHEDGTPYPGPMHPVPQCIATRKPVRNAVMGVYRPVTRDRVWLLVNADPELNPDGSIKEVICTFKDITERLEADELLHKVQQQLNSIMEGTPDIIAMIDCGYRYVLFNSAFHGEIRKIFGKDLVIGDSIQEALAQLPNDLAEVMAYWNRALDGEDFIVIQEFGDAKLNRNWYELHFSPIRDQEGKVVAAMHIARNISERKKMETALQESEQRFRTAVEFSSNSIVVHRDGKIVFVNPAAIKMFGATAASDLLGTLILNRIHPDYHQIILSSVQEAMGSLIEAKYFRLDGTIIDAEVKGAPIVYDGEAAIQASIYDITERKLFEEKITLKSEELQRVNAEKDKFFSIIAHDLRGPFIGFLGLTQLLNEELSGMTSEEIRHVAMLMKNSATNLFNLLGNLLEWSRLQRGLTPFAPTSILISEKFKECSILLEDLWVKKNIVLINEIPPDLKVVVDGDMLGGILRNLLINSTKFTPKGGGITVSARLVSINKVEISIQDTGIGMKKEMIENLFRLDINTGRPGTEGEPSTGLGLIICNDFIEKHGGKLIVESEEGKGSIFRFTLPAGN